MRKGEASDLLRKSDPYGRAVVPAYPLCEAPPRNAPPEGLGLPQVPQQGPQFRVGGEGGVRGLPDFLIL
jgi:hypothetical protein